MSSSTPHTSDTDSILIRGSASYSCSGGGFQRSNKTEGVQQQQEQQQLLKLQQKLSDQSTDVPSQSADSTNENGASPTAATTVEMKSSSLSPHSDQLQHPSALPSADSRDNRCSSTTASTTASAATSFLPFTSIQPTVMSLAALPSAAGGSADLLNSESNVSDDDDDSSSEVDHQRYVLTSAEWSLTQRLREEHLKRGEEITQMEQIIQQQKQRLQTMQLQYESLEQQRVDENARSDHQTATVISFQLLLLQHQRYWVTVAKCSCK